MSNFHNIGEETSHVCMATVGCTIEGKVFPVRCKQWACPVCAPINAYHEAITVANGVYALFAAGVRPTFATITQPPAVKTPEFAYKILADQWDGFRNRWQYWSGKAGVPNYYAAFVEGQSRRAGMPHFHIIGSGMPDKETMRKWAVESGMGYEVDLQPVRPGAGAAWYVSKYSTKSSDAALMPDRFRRVRYSRDWPRMIFRADLEESTAVVKQPDESYAAWSIRASLSCAASPGDLLAEALALADSQGNAVLGERLSRVLLAVNQWA